ncbi:DUF6515 family protein [Kaarinaea lacus]
MKQILKPQVIMSCVVLVALLGLLSSAAYADRDKFDHFNKKRFPSSDLRLDKRYDHNRSYPRPGVFINRLPERRYPIHYHDRDYFYFGGTWYLPSGPRFTVVVPPIGIVVPVLPSFYTTIWFGGVPYYYANDTYYVWRPDLNGYQVTAPPQEPAPSQPTYLADELFVYPKQGQSEEQRAEDRYACHRWAVEQTNYDPSQPPQGLSVSVLTQKREDYRRAQKTCLEGRGYSVR